MVNQRTKKRLKILFIWVGAILITLLAAFYQRITGPTYPKKVKTDVYGHKFNLSLPTSYSSSKDCEVFLPVRDDNIKAKLVYRKYPTNDKWDTVSFIYAPGGLAATLPKQPAAGKLEYYVLFKAYGKTISATKQQPVIIRYKDDVPAWALVPHVILIFLAMLLSNTAGLMAFFKFEKARLYSLITFILLLLGGMILGPIIQKYAFGDFWTGVPFGWDLTDNKTLIAFLAWVVALLANRRKFRPGYIIAAALITLIIFSIPHSMFGSELNHATGTVTTG